MNPIPDNFTGNGMGTARTGRLVAFLLKLGRWGRYKADLDAIAARSHDWAWTADAYEAGGGTYEEFCQSNRQLRHAVYQITESDFLADRCFNIVSYIGYGRFPFITRAEYDLSQQAAETWWAGRSRTAATTIRHAAVFLAGIGVTVSATWLTGLTMAAGVACSAVPWCIAQWHSLKTQSRLRDANPPAAGQMRCGDE